ncbi:hypothetical protein OAM29_02055 [Flavobacteriaceae bacterium]|nr:hypothetical protein [Flavobacteriaceae bacterium]
MKKIILLFIVASFLSCETKTVEVNKLGGMTYYGENTGKKFEIGSEESLKISVSLVNAYAEGDFDLMNDMTTDTVFYFEPSFGKPIPVVNPANDFLTQIQSPYDSITRRIWNAVPLKRAGSDYETVTVSFIENRYKNGEVEKLRIIDRIFIRDSKVFRVNQWNGTVD